MPATGGDQPQAIILYNATGARVSYADKTAFLAASWDLQFYDSSDALLSPQPDWDLPAAGSNGLHVFVYEVPAGAGTCRVVAPSTSHLSSPETFPFEGFTNTIDTVAALLVQSTGVVVSEILTEGSLAVHDDDSILLDFSITEAALAYIGCTDLSDCTITGGIKLDSNNSSAAPDADLTTSIVSDIPGTRTVRGRLDVFDADFAVPAGTGKPNVAATAMIRITSVAEPTRTLIAAQAPVTIAWTAEPT